MANVNKMDRFYEDANDQHVRSTIVYIMDNYVYVDVKRTTRIDGETLKNLFMKNELLMRTDDAEYSRPVVMRHDGGITAIGFAGVDGIQIYYSAEYVPEGE